MKNFIKENYKMYLLIFLISIIVCGVLFYPGFYSGHDMVSHSARVAGTLKAIEDGQRVPTIVPNYCNGFGYSWNLFYGPLFPYLSVAFSFFANGDLFVGMKVVTFLSIFLSGITMYNLMLYTSKSKKLALLSSIIYMCAPYRLSEIFTRFAAGEMLSFVFAPLIFQGLYSLFNDNGKKHYLLTVGLAGMILSHNLSTMMICVLAGIYGLINIKKVFKKEVFIKLCINAIFVILITSFFTLPMMQSKMATDYKAFEAGAMGSPKGMENHAAYLSQLVTTELRNGGYSTPLNETDVNIDMCFAIGIFILIPLIFTPIIYKKIPKERRKDYLFLLIAGIISLILCSVYFPWSKMPLAVGVIQFPWRFLMLAVFTLSIVASINIALLIENFNMTHILILTTVIFVNISPMLNPVAIDFNATYLGYYELDVVKEDDIGTGAMSSFDYLPIKAINNVKYIANRTQEPILISGNADILDSSKDGTKLNFTVQNVTENTIIELPYIYYLGYNVKLIEGDNQQSINIFESENGFVAIELPKAENANITVKYTGTRTARTCAIISVISGGMFIIYIIIYSRKRI